MATAGSHPMERLAGNSTLYEVLKALPEGITGEILDGQLHTYPRPGFSHGVASSNLGAELIGPYSRGRGGPGGWWIIDEPELHFVRNNEVVVPDLAAWRRDRMPEFPPDHRVEVVPDWICEVLSPSTRSKDLEIKMPIYARYGVKFAWIVDPRSKTLEAYQRDGSEWSVIVSCEAEDTASIEPFELASFVVGDLWR